MHLRKSLLVLSMLALISHPVCGAEKEEGTKDAIEATSPDGQFAFHHTPASEKKGQTYDLIEKQSGKVLANVAAADLDPAPSDRFEMKKVLWKADSKAFALTAMLSKRGSDVVVYLRDGATFREITLPELIVVIPTKTKGGKEQSHFSEIGSQTAKQWQKDGTLVVEIETIVDGSGKSTKATRTVVLSFDKSDKAKIVKSTTKYANGKP